MCRAATPALSKERAREQGDRNAEVKDEPRHVDQGRDERGRRRGRVEPHPVQEQGEHTPRGRAERDDAREAQPDRRPHPVRVPAIVVPAEVIPEDHAERPQQPEEEPERYPPRFLSIAGTPTSRYGAWSASVPPIFWMSSVASSSATSARSSAVIMPRSRPPSPTTGRAR